MVNVFVKVVHVQIAMEIVVQVAGLIQELVQLEPDQPEPNKITLHHAKQAEIVPVNPDLPELNATIHHLHPQVRLEAVTLVVSRRQDRAEAEEFVNKEPNET
jgi:hypothetical protein